MTEAGNVPVAVAATYFDYDTSQPKTFQLALGLGANRVKPAQYPQSGGYWFVVVSLIDLSVAVNEFVPFKGVPSYSTVPDSVKKYAGNTDYFLFFVTHFATVVAVPQGDLYKMLMNAGAGRVALPSVEEVFATLGSENLRMYSYVLAATLDPKDDKGFEALSFTSRAVLNFRFMPVTVDGKTRYVPIRLR